MKKKRGEMDKLHNVKLDPHQRTALSKMKDGCILWGGVGSGKSRVGLAYYMLTENKEDIYVITTAKKRDSMDWTTEAARFGIGRELGATLAGVLTIDSWNNIEKYVGVENAFFIFDEQRLVGSGKWVKSFLKIAKKNRWIMLSATPGDNWMDYIPVMVANGFYKNRTEFKSEHVIQAPFVKYFKVERYVNVQRLVRQRNQILIHMPYPRETTRHSVTIWCEYDENTMARIAHGRWNIFEDKPIRDISDLFHQMRKVTNTDPSRLKAVWDLLAKHDRLIIFYNFDYELAILRTLKESEPEFEYAEWNGHRHEEIPQGEKWIYVVQYIAGAEGWNCTTTNTVVFWSLTYSYKLWEQAHGRIDRISTKYEDLYYYILRSKAEIDWAIWRSIKSKKSFQTKDFDMTSEEFADYYYQRERA
jgi:hypothetical protein